MERPLSLALLSWSAPMRIVSTGYWDAESSNEKSWLPKKRRSLVDIIFPGVEVLTDFGDFNFGVIFRFQVFIWCTLWFSFSSLVCQWTLHFEGRFPSPAWRRDFCGCTNHGNRGWNDLVFLPAGNVLGWWAFRRLMSLPISTETRFPNLDGEGFGWNWRFMDFCFFLETNRGLGCFFFPKCGKKCVCFWFIYESCGWCGGLAQISASLVCLRPWWA